MNYHSNLLMGFWRTIISFEEDHMKYWYVQVSTATFDAFDHFLLTPTYFKHYWHLQSIFIHIQNTIQIGGSCRFKVTFHWCPARRVKHLHISTVPFSAKSFCMLLRLHFACDSSTLMIRQFSGKKIKKRSHGHIMEG